MILSILFWVMMQGQSKAQVKACKADPGCMVVQHLDLEKSGPRWRCDKSGCTTLKSTEHVFEIRTRREKAIVWTDGTGKEWCDEGCEYHAAHWVGGVSEAIENAECVRVTKELWIDGVKQGVIKETEAEEKH